MRYSWPGNIRQLKNAPFIVHLTQLEGYELRPQDILPDYDAGTVSVR